jgi:hypothetical protein
MPMPNEIKASVVRSARALLSEDLNARLTDEEVWRHHEDYGLSDKSISFAEWING